MYNATRPYDTVVYLSDGSIPVLGGKCNIVHMQVPFHGVGGRSWKNVLKKRFINHVIVNSHFTKKIVASQLDKIFFMPIVTSLKPGEILAKKEGNDLPLATSGGFVEFAENELTILADTAERVEEIDEARAEEGRSRAARLLEQQQGKSELDFASVAAKLEKELARLKVSQKYRHLKRSGPQIQIIKDE